MFIYLIITEIKCPSVAKQKYVTTDVTVSLMIYVTFFMILFVYKFQFLRKLFYVIDTVGLIAKLMTSNLIYIYSKIAVYSINEKVNLHIDLKNRILLNIYLSLLIFNY